MPRNKNTAPAPEVEKEKAPEVAKAQEPAPEVEKEKEPETAPEVEKEKSSDDQKEKTALPETAVVYTPTNGQTINLGGIVVPGTGYVSPDGPCSELEGFVGRLLSKK